MFLLGVVIALAGALATASWFMLGPHDWVPFAFLAFCLGCLIAGLASVKHTIEASAAKIVAAIDRKPVSPSPSETFAAPIARPSARDEIDEAAVMPTPHPSRRRPSFEELTGKSEG